MRFVTLMLKKSPIYWTIPLKHCDDTQTSFATALKSKLPEPMLVLFSLSKKIVVDGNQLCVDSMSLSQIGRFFETHKTHKTPTAEFDEQGFIIYLIQSGVLCATVVNKLSTQITLFSRNAFIYFRCTTCTTARHQCIFCHTQSAN